MSKADVMFEKLGYLKESVTMSDDEKKAVETLKDLASTIYYGDMNFIESDDLKIILKLIEKQQKEIKELKEKEKNLLKQLKDSEKELLEVTQNVVSKDKIRYKIEELNKESKDLIKKGNFESRNDGFEATDIEGLNDLINYQSKGIIIKILQELLKEE